MSAKKLGRHEQVVLFEYLCTKGLPKWAKDQVAAFARLMNITTLQAKKAYERAYHSGWLLKDNR